MGKLYLFIFAASLFFVSCKSASKLYQKGNYEDAIQASVKKLQKKPNDAETKNLLQKAYTYAVNQHEDQIRILSNSNSETRFEQIFYQYNQLQNLYVLLRQYPTVSELIKPADYSSYIQTYQNKAAAVHIERAEKWMEENSKPAYREAYKEFKAAQFFQPDDIDLKRRTEDAYNAALVKVVVIPMNLPERFASFNNASYRFRNFQDQMIYHLNQANGNDFIKFFTVMEAEGRKLVPDEVLEMQLGNIIIGQPYDQVSTRELSKEVVVKEIVYKPDSVIKQYAKVQAKITTTCRLLNSEATLFITAKDAKGKMIWSDNFKGAHNWQTEIYSYTGDERALTTSDKDLLNKKMQSVPPQDEIMDQLFSQIQNNVAYKLKSYYNHYQ